MALSNKQIKSDIQQRVFSESCSLGQTTLGYIRDLANIYMSGPLQNAILYNPQAATDIVAQWKVTLDYISLDEVLPDDIDLALSVLALEPSALTERLGLLPKHQFDASGTHHANSVEWLVGLAQLFISAFNLIRPTSKSDDPANLATAVVDRLSSVRLLAWLLGSALGSIAEFRKYQGRTLLAQSASSTKTTQHVLNPSSVDAMAIFGRITSWERILQRTKADLFYAVVECFRRLHSAPSTAVTASEAAGTDSLDEESVLINTVGGGSMRIVRFLESEGLMLLADSEWSIAIGRLGTSVFEWVVRLVGTIPAKDHPGSDSALYLGSRLLSESCLWIRALINMAWESSRGSHGVYKSCRNTVARVLFMVLSREDNILEVRENNPFVTAGAETISERVCRRAADFVFWREEEDTETNTRPRPVLPDFSVLDMLIEDLYEVVHSEKDPDEETLYHEHVLSSTVLIVAAKAPHAFSKALLRDETGLRIEQLTKTLVTLLSRVKPKTAVASSQTVSDYYDAKTADVEPGENHQNIIRRAAVSHSSADLFIKRNETQLKRQLAEEGSLPHHLQGIPRPCPWKVINRLMYDAGLDLSDSNSQYAPYSLKYKVPCDHPERNLVCFTPPTLVTGSRISFEFDGLYIRRILLFLLMSMRKAGADEQRQSSSIYPFELLFGLRPVYLSMKQLNLFHPYDIEPDEIVDHPCILLLDILVNLALNDFSQYLLKPEASVASGENLELLKYAVSISALAAETLALGIIYKPANSVRPFHAPLSYVICRLIPNDSQHPVVMFARIQKIATSATTPLLVLWIASRAFFFAAEMEARIQLDYDDRCPACLPQTFQQNAATACQLELDRPRSVHYIRRSARLLAFAKDLTAQNFTEQNRLVLQQLAAEASAATDDLTDHEELILGSSDVMSFLVRIISLLLLTHTQKTLR